MCLLRGGGPIGVWRRGHSSRAVSWDVRGGAWVCVPFTHPPSDPF